MMDRIEWMAEKATEIGFDELDFLDCKFSERKTLRTDRVERIVVSAMKQSHKAHKPMVGEMEPFGDYVTRPREGRKFIAHCYAEIERKDLFAIGDGAGVTRGLAQAGASGVCAAQAILKRL